MTQKRQSQRATPLSILNLIAQLILLPVALGIGLYYELVGVQAFVLVVYLLLSELGKINLIVQLVFLPVALGAALHYGLLGIQVFALVYLLLFVRRKVFPSQFFIRRRDQEILNDILSPPVQNTIYYLLFGILSVTMWGAFLASIVVLGTEDLLIRLLESDPALEQWYWSVLIASPIVIAIIALILILDGLARMNTYLADYAKALGDYPFWPTLWAMISIRLGINRRVELVEDGKSKTLKAPGGGWARFAGPGLLIVTDGHAVALERGGTISRIVGAGITFTKRYERPNLIVPLRTETIARPIMNVVTRDGVMIEEFSLFVYYQVDPGSGQRSGGSEFAYDPDHIKKIWRLVGKDWDSIKPAMESIADTSLRDVIATHDLDEIFVAKGMEPSPTAGQLEPRQRIKNEVRDQINTVSLESLAIKVVAVDIGEVKIPKEAEQRLLEKWLADWAVRVAESKTQEARTKMVREAEAERDAAILKAEAAAIKARGDREAALEKGRGKAAARAEQVGEIVKALQQAGLRDDQMITNIIREISRAVGYEDYFRSLEIMSGMPARLPSRTRRLMRGESEVEEEEGQAE